MPGFVKKEYFSINQESRVSLVRKQRRTFEIGPKGVRWTITAVRVWRRKLMPSLTFRSAKPEDAVSCIRIRGLTRENAFSEEQLRELGITAESWGAGIEDASYPGFVACIDDEMIGYCFGDRDSGEIVVLALLPAYEGRGIGKALLAMMVTHLQKQGFQRLFLACASDPRVRSYGFYRHLGWKSTGDFDELGDEVLELICEPMEYRP